MPPKREGPDLNKYMDKSLQLKLNGNRLVTGKLRGFDQFLNIVLDDTIEHRKTKIQKSMDTTTNHSHGKQQQQQQQQQQRQDTEIQTHDYPIGTVVIRGNSILMIEALEKI